MTRRRGDQPTLFDAKASEGAREEAIERVDRHAKKSWKLVAHEAVARVARRHDTFTSDDVWRDIPPDAAETHEPRALGPIMRAAAASGIIEATNEHRLSAMVSCHRRPKRVWRSLLNTLTRQDVTRPDPTRRDATRHDVTRRDWTTQPNPKKTQR